MEFNTAYIISDLHLAEGNLGQGITLGTENFFGDVEFDAFINHLLDTNPIPNKGMHLIINGDFVDFIRITLIPDSSDLEIWQNEINLADNNINVLTEEFDKKEIRYGLKTNDYKCVWKLYKSISGHQLLFEALARWVGSGHQLTINAGNHDPEWYWPLVQDYFRQKLFLIESECNPIAPDVVKFKRLICFQTEAFTIYDQVLIEHGHNYDRMTEMCAGYELGACIKKFPQDIPQYKKELFLPFGSFFNRYLVNRVEFSFPYVDNLTTGKAMFKAVLDEDFSTALSILKNYGLYAVYASSKNFKRTLLELLILLLSIILPVVLLGFLLYNSFIRDEQFFSELPKWLNFILVSVGNFLLPYITKVFISNLLTWVGWKDKPLQEKAFEIISDREENIIVFGHNHNAQHLIRNGKQYINPGSWTSTYVQKFKRIQTGVKYAVARIINRNEDLDIDLFEWKMSINSLVHLPTFKTSHDEK